MMSLSFSPFCLCFIISFRFSFSHVYIIALVDEKLYGYIIAQSLGLVA